MAPADIVHVQPPLVRATEIIREHLFAYLRKELPYLVEQRNIGWTELDWYLRIQRALSNLSDG